MSNEHTQEKHTPRRIPVIVEVNWPEYEDVSDDLVLEDAIRDVAAGVKVYPDDIHSSLVEALEKAEAIFKRLSDEGHYPEFLLAENGGEGFAFIKAALSNTKG